MPPQSSATAPPHGRTAPPRTGAVTHWRWLGRAGSRAALAGLCAGLLGCTTHLAEVSSASVADAVFTDTDTFSRTYANTPQASCEAARRALLSQAYLMTDVTDQRVSARKHFQRSREQHYEVEFHVTCVGNPDFTSTVFVSAVQQLYGLRKTNSSASVGVGIFGSLSVPIKSEDDSLVKIGSVTLTKDSLYQRFFDLLQDHLGTIEGSAKAAQPAAVHAPLGDAMDLDTQN